MLKSAAFHKVLKNNSFLLLITGQGISGFGDAFQIIATTSLLVKMTGSGLAAGFALICTPLSSLFLSPVAGILGDKGNSRHILIFIDLVRGAIAVLFTLNFEIHVIYFLILLLSSFDILYNPVRSRLLTNIIDSRHLVHAVSLQGGMSGITCLPGLLLAGIAIENSGPNIAFFVNSFSFFVSAFLIFFIKYDKSKIYQNKLPRQKSQCCMYGNIMKSIKQLRIAAFLKIGFLTGFCTASVNVTFYTFAFDTLGITAKGWSLLLSTLYGTNLIAMFLSIVFIKKIEKKNIAYIYILMGLTSIVWFVYSTLKNLKIVIFLQIFEGTMLSLLGILLGAYLLIKSGQKFAAGVIAGNDFFGNAGKLAGISLTFIILGTYKYNYVFIMNSAVYLIYSLYKLFSRKSRPVTQ